MYILYGRDSRRIVLQNLLNSPYDNYTNKESWWRARLFRTFIDTSNVKPVDFKCNPSYELY